ncbi:MAG: DUF5703 domain-containing protein [Planctomycetaceae bacterium]|nr:DUF5703 domain-containing protein [Planctomycetaceae bacterium]
MRKNNFNCFVTMLILSMLPMFIFNATINGEESSLSLYKIVWETPSKNVYETMPLGNGEVGINAWIDETGDLKFYIARIDSLDEFARILKLGSVRIRIGEPDKKRTAQSFRQILDVKRGVLEASYGIDAEKVSLRLWVDANRPVIVVEITAGKPVTATAFGEIWRTKQEKIPPTEYSDFYCVSKFEMLVEPDNILENLKHEIGWYHRNIHSEAYERSADLQDMNDYPRENPILHRTFGTLIRCERPNRIDDLTLQSTEGQTHRFEIAAMTKHPATEDEWIAETKNTLDSAQKTAIDERRQKHELWWKEFFDRSWIHITQNENSASTEISNVIPVNKHSVVIGQDQRGGSKIQGQFGRVALYQKNLTDTEIQKLAQTQPTEIIDAKNTEITKPFFATVPTEPMKLNDSADWVFNEGMTVEAWVCPSKIENYFRIVDKSTVGVGDGFLFDLTPNGGLRFVLGEQFFVTNNVFSVGNWSHVAAVVLPNGTVQLFVNGKFVTDNALQEANLSDTYVLSRAYTLQRYVSACAGRGRYPIKFNGSLFTVPEKGRPGDADYRQWGTGYWFQNTRLPYISMSTAGDFDLMQPFFKMYFDLLPVCQYRTKKNLGLSGAYFPECMYFWGDVFPELYRWSPPVRERKDKLEVSGYTKRYWTSGLEISFMAIEYYEYTEDEKFLLEKAIPFATEILTFFDQRYSVGANGKFVMYPSQSLETWWDCEEPAPEIAGMRAVIERLERLPENLLTADQRKFLAELKQKLPELPVTKSPEGNLMLAPAKRFASKHNVENTELYSVYPFRLISYDKPNVELAVEAFKHRRDRGAFGWRQDDLFAAYLGLTDEAKNHLIKRAKTKHTQSRFPVFWGPNYDWIPDQDHGNILCKGVQSLIMQCDGNRIDLFPAFPPNWDCEFKLNAPYKTTVEGQLKDGKLINLKVTPKEREKDVHVLLEKSDRK